MIWIYEQGHEDFSTNGLGSLRPARCEIKEELNGAYELELDHPIDEDGLFGLLKTGRVIKAPVPAQTTPIIRMPATTSYEVWETSAKAKVYTKKSTTLGTTVSVTVPGIDLKSKKYDVVAVRGLTENEPKTVTKWKPNGNRVLEKVEAGIEVSVLEKDGTWYRVTTPNGNTGWMQAASLTLVASIAARPPETIQERKIRDQLFRIYRAEKDTEAGEVRAWARHISYDLLGNVLLDCNVNDKTVAQAIAQIDASCTQADHGFTIYTDSTATITADWSRKGYLEALLDPDEGLLSLANLRLVRDNYDLFLLERSEVSRQSVSYGTNLVGVTLDINEDSIVNRIVPVGKTKDGEPLYIDEEYVDSPRNNEATIIRAKVIEYSDVVEKDDEPAVTLAQAKAALIARANTDFEQGIDLPDVSVDIDFLQLGDTVEYAAYRDLDRLYLGDLITVRDDAHDVELDAEITQVDYDVLTNRYIHMNVGVTEAARTIGSTASFMLPNGSLGGRKIALGSLDGGHIKELSAEKITTGTLDAGVINVVNLNADNITTGYLDAGIIEAGTITATHIGTNEIVANAANIKDGVITNAKIAAAGIDFANIKDLNTETAIFRTGVGDALYLDRLVVNDANFASAIAGKLMIRDTDGKLYRISVNSSGAVTATQVQVNGDSLTDNAVMSVSQRLLWRQATQPSAPWVGMLWLDTTTEKLKRCTAITPSVAWEVVPAGEVHTAVIDVDDNGMNILTGGELNVLGGSVNIKSLDGVANVINMDSTGLTISSTGQLKLTSADSIIIGGSPFSVGGTNLIINSDFTQGIWPATGADASYSSNFNGKPSVALTLASGSTYGYIEKTITRSMTDGSVVLSFELLGSTSYISGFSTAWVAHLRFNFAGGGGTSRYITPSDVTSHPRWQGGKFSRVSKVIALPAGQDVSEVVLRLCISSSSNPGSTLRFAEVQLEYANKETPWSPAPEDPASGVKTSSVEVNTNGIYMDTTGDFSLNAGVNVNIRGGSGTSEIGLSNSASLPFLWAGGTSSTAPFRVQRDGSVIATKIQHEMPYTFWDMADADAPAEFPIYIPAGYTIDSVTFTFQTKKARTFAKGASSGGGSTSGTNSGYNTGTSNQYTAKPTGSVFADHTHLASHSHWMDGHSHTTPAHTHGINYGINEKSTLATSCALKVGATTIGTYSPNPSNPVEIKAYLAAGWNTVIVAPNNDARIVAFALVKLTPA